MSSKVDYLNVGCGKKFHPDWENIDMVSHSKHVRAYNLLKGFPYSDGQFQAVYHCQVLEHIPKESAADFIKECHRVLKANGILRVVVPDLENIMREYNRLLEENLNNPTKESEANYDWIMLEIYDQTIRNSTGGQMRNYLAQEKLVNPAYMAGRMGFVGAEIRKSDKKETTSEKMNRVIKETGLFGFLKLSGGLVKQKLLNTLLGEKYRVWSFRLGGEVHYWMYDRYSLTRLLKSVGFKDIQIKSPQTSDIPNFNTYELDVKGEMIYDPTSLFIEARK